MDAAAQEKWGPHLDFEAKLGSKRNLGEGDLFVPLVQDARTLWFGNLRARFDDESSSEGNLGAGVRRMMDGGWNLGAYGYVDRRKTELGNKYSQVTLGGEALGRDWDFRANAYLPTGTKVRDAGSTETASIAANTLTVTSVTREERALKGFDAEVGWRVPLFGIEDARQLRVYAGGYRFKDEVAKVAGPRLRAELAMAEVPGLWRGAELTGGLEVQDDDIRGRQTFLTVRLRVPLGGDKVPTAKLNWQERRMTAPVLRDVDVVAPVISRAPVSETANTLANGQPLTVISSDAIAGGTALRNAILAAGPNSTVLLSGTFVSAAGGLVSVSAGQTLMGAGSFEVRTASGRRVTVTTPMATVRRSGQTVIASTANDITITGLRIEGVAGSSAGIQCDGCSGLIAGNVLALNQTNAVAINGTPSNTVIRDNTIMVSGLGQVFGLGLHDGTTNVTVTGNSISAIGGPGSGMVRLGNVSVASGSTGNVRLAGDCVVVGIVTGTISFTNFASCP